MSGVRAPPRKRPYPSEDGVAMMSTLERDRARRESKFNTAQQGFRSAVRPGPSRSQMSYDGPASRRPPRGGGRADSKAATAGLSDWKPTGGNPCPWTEESPKKVAEHTGHTGENDDEDEEETKAVPFSLAAGLASQLRAVMDNYGGEESNQEPSVQSTAAPSSASTQRRNENFDRSSIPWKRTSRFEQGEQEGHGNFRNGCGRSRGFGRGRGSARPSRFDRHDWSGDYSEPYGAEMPRHDLPLGISRRSPPHHSGFGPPDHNPNNQWQGDFQEETKPDHYGYYGEEAVEDMTNEAYRETGHTSSVRGGRFASGPLGLSTRRHQLMPNNEEYTEKADANLDLPRKNAQRPSHFTSSRGPQPVSRFPVPPRPRTGGGLAGVGGFPNSPKSSGPKPSHPAQRPPGKPVYDVSNPNAPKIETNAWVECMKKGEFDELVPVPDSGYNKKRRRGRNPNYEEGANADPEEVWFREELGIDGDLASNQAFRKNLQMLRAHPTIAALTGVAEVLATSSSQKRDMLSDSDVATLRAALMLYAVDNGDAEPLIDVFGRFLSRENLAIVVSSYKQDPTCPSNLAKGHLSMPRFLDVEGDAATGANAQPIAIFGPVKRITGPGPEQRGSHAGPRFQSHPQSRDGMDWLRNAPRGPPPNNQAGPAPQYNQAGPGPHYNQAGPGSHFSQAGPGPHYNQAGPGSHFSQAGPGPHYNQAGPGPHYNQAGPGPQYNQAGPGPHYNQAGPGHHFSQAGPGPHYSQPGPGPHYNQAGPGLQYNQGGPPHNQAQPASLYNQAGPPSQYNQAEYASQHGQTGPGPAAPHANANMRPPMPTPPAPPPPAPSGYSAQAPSAWTTVAAGEAADSTPASTKPESTFPSAAAAGSTVGSYTQLDHQQAQVLAEYHKRYAAWYAGYVQYRYQYQGQGGPPPTRSELVAPSAPSWPQAQPGQYPPPDVHGSNNQTTNTAYPPGKPPLPPQAGPPPHLQPPPPPQCGYNATQ